MQIINFNGSIVATHGDHIAIADTYREAQISLIKQLPKPKRPTLVEQIKRAKHARTQSRLVKMF